MQGKTVMADVPKIVLERLKAASAKPTEHPDADVLTAFAERALPDRERDSVLKHLAGCSECREVVALALPASDATAPLVAHSGHRWVTWPTLRWGFAAAGIVLVASLTVVQYQRRTRVSVASNKGPAVSEARNEAPSTTSPPASAPAPQSVDQERDKSESSTPKSLDSFRTKKAPASADAGPTAPVAPPPEIKNPTADGSSIHGVVGRRIPGVAGGPMPHGPKMGFQMNQANQWQQQNANSFAAQSAAVPAAAPAQNVANLPTQGRSDTNLDKIQREPHGQTETLIVQSESLSQQQPQGGTAETKVDRAKPLETVIVSNSRRYAGAPPSAKLARSSPLAGARWTINPSGGLQRSVDEGATWQDVNVNEPAPAAASELYMAKEERQSVMKEKTSLKDQKQATTPMIFRAVAANGADVWAGGVNGALYHSSDAGNSWTRIVPASAGVPLTGDIVSVNFSDAQHGRVSTSTSETWTTGDGGESWQKQ